MRAVVHSRWRGFGARFPRRGRSAVRAVGVWGVGGAALMVCSVCLGTAAVDPGGPGAGPVVSGEAMGGAGPVERRGVASGLPVASRPAVMAWLRDALGDGAAAGDGGALEPAIRGAAMLVAEHPGGLVLASECLHALGAERGLRSAEVAAALREALAARGGGDGGALRWLVEVGAAGDDFEGDRDALLRAMERIEGGGLSGAELFAMRIVGARMLIALHRYDDAFAMVRAMEDGHSSAAADSEWGVDARLRLLGLCGRDVALIELALRHDPDGGGGGGGGGGGAGAREDAALSERLALAARSAERINQRGLAIALRAAARDARPGLLERHEELIWLLMDDRGALGRSSISPELARALRSLRAHHPDAALLDHILVVQALRRGQGALVLGQLERLSERHPDDARLRADLVGVLIELRETDRAGALLESRLETIPSTLHAPDLILLASVMLATGDPVGARRRLGIWIDRHGDEPEVLRELERVLGTSSFSRADALEMQRRRLNIEPPTIANLITRADLLSNSGDWDEALGTVDAISDRLLEQGIVPARFAGDVGGDRVVGASSGATVTVRAELSILQRARLMMVLGRFGSSGRDEVEPEALLAALDRADAALGGLPESLAMERVELTIATGGGLAAALDLSDALCGDDPLLRRAVFTRLYREVTGEGERREALFRALRETPEASLMVARRGALGGGGDDPYLFEQWMYACVRAGSSEPGGPDAARRIRDSMSECIRASARAGVLEEALELSLARLPIDGMGDLCLQLVLIVDADVHWDAASLLYEHALRVDPWHVSINNSYGYQLLERDERVHRAAEMIARAFERAPDDANIIDSMGWARYKLGVLVDPARGDGDGDGARGGEAGDDVEAAAGLGAVTLLERAAEGMSLPAIYDPKPDGSPPDLPALENIPAAHFDSMLSRPTVLEHLGCALWAVGRREEAVRSWEDARRAAIVARAVIGRLPRASEMQSEPVGREIERVDTAVRGYLDAVVSGAPPRIPSHTPPASPAPVAPSPGGDGQAGGDDAALRARSSV